MLICLNEHNKHRCNTQNRNGAKFCKQCGKRLRFHSTLPAHDPDRVIGHYRIIRMIGHGAFGAVYEAEDTQDVNGRVALKETLDSSRINSFKREFKVLQGLEHDHLPRYYDMFEAQGHGYLVMELIPGQDLKAVLKKRQRPLVEKQVLGYAIQLGDALSYLHNQTPRILHRDIKPANIRLTPDGLIKLVDFGLFKVGDQTTHKSRHGWTPAYAPFEQWGGGTDPRSDLYSLGATLYHLLTNRVPLAAPKRIGISPDPLSPAQELNPNLSPHVAEALMRAIAVQAEERYADVRTMIQALVAVSAPVVSAPRPPTEPITIPDISQRGNDYVQLLTTEPITIPDASQTGDDQDAPQPPTNSITSLIVSQTGEGEYQTINEAIRNASAGSQILVRPGLYAESLIIDKPLQIRGYGPVEEIIVESIDASCLRMQSKHAEVRGLTLRGRVGPKSNSFYIVDIPQGELLLEDCHITSDSLACVAIYGADANPVIRRCKIHDGSQAGVFVYKNGQGTLEECDIFANVRAGVVIMEGGNPLVQRCRIHHGKANGVYAYDKGKGTIEECEIFGNAYAGVAIKQGANTVIRLCQIHEGLQNGVRVYKNGQGTIEQCEIFRNARAGVEIRQGGNALIRRCKIYKGWQDGVLVDENSKGTIEECEIFGNAYAGVRIESGGNALIRGGEINRNQYQVLRVDENSVTR